MSEVKEDPAKHPKTIKGCRFPDATWFPRKNIEDAMKYVPKDGDVILAAYPKTGTNWLQYIILQIVSKGEWFPEINDTTTKVAPFMEMVGVDALDAIESEPRIYKHHIRYDLMQKNKNAKYIYIYRHPEDTAVSFYHYLKDFRPDRHEKTEFDQFFEKFEVGDLAYGSYFEHVLSYYEGRVSGGLLMVSYEDLYARRREGILRIARFLGDEYHQCLLEREDVMNKVIAHTSFDYMKKNLRPTNPFSKENGAVRVNFFRKGIVGDGKNVLTADQKSRIKEAARKVLNGTAIMDEWYSK